MIKFSKWKVPPTGAQPRRNKLLVSWGPLVIVFEMRWTVPVPMPSDLATHKISTPEFPPALIVWRFG